MIALYLSWKGELPASRDGEGKPPSPTEADSRKAKGSWFGFGGIAC